MPQILIHMDSKKLARLVAAFADVFDLSNSPTHDAMTGAFLRAGVDSTYEGGLSAPTKRRRIFSAFEEAREDPSSEQTRDLVEALVRALKQRNVFVRPSPDQADALRDLLDALNQNGWDCSANGTLIRTGAVVAPTLGDAALDDHIARLQDSRDIPSILGDAKDTLEAIAKFIIREHGQTFENGEVLEDLIKRAMSLVGIEEKPSDTDSESAKALANINQVVPKIAKAIRQARNTDGTGHGRIEVSSLREHEAQFVRDLALSASRYLRMESTGQ